MLSMSNTKPDRMKAGRKVAMMAIWPATNWLRATPEISSPMPSAASMNRAEAAVSTRSEPRSGTSNRTTAIATEAAMPPMPSTK